MVINDKVDLHLADGDDSSLSARLSTGMPGVDRNVAEELVKDAEPLCPSKAMRGNVAVTIDLV